MIRLLSSVASPLNDLYFALRSVLEGRSSRWPSCRRQHLKREPLCQCCLVEGDNDVHHVIPFHQDRSLELEESNLITLCPRCHLLMGHLGRWTRVNPDVRRDAQTIRRKVVDWKIEEAG